MEKPPKIVQKSPYLIDEKADKKAFCTCGLSGKNPYCDESQRDRAFSKIIRLEERIA